MLNRKVFDILATYVIIAKAIDTRRIYYEAYQNFKCEELKRHHEKRWMRRMSDILSVRL